MCDDPKTVDTICRTIVFLAFLLFCWGIRKYIFISIEKDKG